MENNIESVFENASDRRQVSYYDDEINLFKDCPAAFFLHAHVMGKPPHYKFHRKYFYSQLGFSDRQLRKAINFLKSIGLLETFPIRKKTNVVGSEYKFYAFRDRVQVKHYPETRGPQKGTIAYQKTNPKPSIPASGKGSSDCIVLSPSQNDTNIYTKGDMQGGNAKSVPPKSPKRPSWNCEQTPNKRKPPTFGIDVEQATRFLKHFDGPHTFQTFSDSKNNPSLAKILTGDKHLLNLDALNQQGAGVYLTINETTNGGRKAADVTRIRAVYVDLDGSPLEPVYQHFPHLIVETSPGKFHVYWFVSDMPIEAFKQTQEILIEKFNGDVHVKDLSRVMRVPGFYHLKEKPFMTQIVYERHHRPFTFQEIVEKFPPKPKKLWSKPKNVVKSFSHPDERAEYRGGYGVEKGDRNESTMRAVCGMIKRGCQWDYIESEAFKHGRACSPPLPDSEIQTVLSSCRRYS